MYSIRDLLALSKKHDEVRSRGVLEGYLYQPPRNSLQSWRETLYVTIADGTAVTAAARTILVPDFSLPGNYLYPGRALKYTLFGRMTSPITTPGTFVHSLMYGGAGGTVLAASGAYAPDPTAASANIAWYVEYYSICRSIGASGTQFTMGRMSLGDYDDATATTLKGNLDMHQFPDVPAAVTINTTAASALSPCVTPSLGTGSVTCHMAILEALT